MQQVGQTLYKPFRLFSKLSWTKPKNTEAFHVVSFKYSLALCFPSVYSKLVIMVPAEQKKEIIECKKLDPLDRKVSVFSIPEIEMLDGSAKLFSGPWNFMLYDFKEYDTTRSMSMIYSLPDRIQPKNYTLFSMDLIDPLFYSLYRSTSNSRSFGNIKISDVVSTVISPHGKIKLLEKTKEKYKWCQAPNISDYNFIRSLLPYSRSDKGNINYHFFCYNQEAYFASIGSEPPLKTRIVLPNETRSESYKAVSGELIAERFISEKNVHIMDSGFVEKPENKNPKKDNLNTNNGGIYKSDSSTLIRTAIEDPVLQEIYVSNLRKRTMMINRCISTYNSVITDYTPLSMIQVINNNEDQRNVNDGNYYIMFLENNFGYNESYPYIAYCRLAMCSESDIVGRESNNDNNGKGNRRKINKTTPVYSDNPYKPIRIPDFNNENKPDPFNPNPPRTINNPPKSPAINPGNLTDNSDDFDYQIGLIQEEIERQRKDEIINRLKPYIDPKYPITSIGSNTLYSNIRPNDFDINYVGKPVIGDNSRLYTNIKDNNLSNIDNSNNTNNGGLGISIDNIEYIYNSEDDNLIIVTNNTSSEQERLLQLQSFGYDVWTSTYPKCYRKTNGRFFNLENDKEILKPAYAIPFNQQTDVVNWTSGVIGKIWYIEDLPVDALISYEKNIEEKTSFYPDNPEDYGIIIGLDDHRTKDVIEGKNV